jgi:HK97 family phage major capsid protein
MVTSLKAAQGVNAKTFTEQVEDSLKANAETFAKLKNDKSTGNVLFNVDLSKAAGTMTTANYSGGTVGLTTFDPMFARVVRRQPFLRQIVTTRPISSKYIAWAEQAIPDGGAGATAEGAAKTQADFDIVERSKLVEKITSYIKVSKEALDDIGFLRSEIDTELVEVLSLKLDADILGANGVTPNVSGILGYATTFNPAGTVFEDAIPNANNFDVIRAVTATLANTNYQANYVLINPLDAGLIHPASLRFGGGDLCGHWRGCSPPSNADSGLLRTVY